MRAKRYTYCFIAAASVALVLSSCGEEYRNDPGAHDGGTDSGGSSSFGGTTLTAGTNAQGGSLAGTPSSAGAAGVAGAFAGTPGTAGAAAAGMAGAAGTPSHPTFHVFLLLGQSNMSGYPTPQAADRVEDERIKVLGFDDCGRTGRAANQWDTAAPPLHTCGVDALGPGDYFAKTLVEHVPPGDTIGLVPCAINGAAVDSFMKVGGTKYSWIVERAKLALQSGGVIEGILFHQGESNNGESTWPAKVNTLITDLRADLALGNVPLLAGELAYTGNCSTHNAYVDLLPTVVSNAYVISAEGLAIDPLDTQWNLHFDRNSQVTLGQRYAEKMRTLLGW